MNKVIIKKYVIFLAIIIATVGIGLFVNLKQIPKIFSTNVEIKSKKTVIKDLNNSIELIKKKQIEEMENNIKETKSVYEPEIKSGDDLSYGGLLETILNLAKQSGLKTKTVEFKPIPESDLIKTNHSSTHNATLLTAQMAGTYTELQNFLREIYRHRYIMSINELKVSPYEFDKKILIIDISLGLYSRK